MHAEKHPDGLWRVDLHIHTRYSSDSHNDPAEVIDRARQVGLDKIAITDHNTIAGALVARELAPNLVIVGQEIDTADGGELIAYYVQKAIPPYLPMEQVIRLLRQQGAVISISHPLDRFRRSAMGERATLAVIEQVDALEVFNARCLLQADNERALSLALRYGKAFTAGSDAHTLGEVGKGYLILPQFGDAADSFVSSLNQARPAGRLTGIWPHLLTRVTKLTRMVTP